MLFIGIAVSDRFKPDEWLDGQPKSQSRTLVATALLFFTFALFGELFAIELAFSSGRPAYKVAFVISTVSLVTVFAATVAAWPFIIRLNSLGKTTVGVGAAVFFIYSGLQLSDTVGAVQIHEAETRVACITRAQTAALNAYDAHVTSLGDRAIAQEDRSTPLLLQLALVSSSTTATATLRERLVTAELKISEERQKQDFRDFIVAVRTPPPILRVGDFNELTRLTGC